MQLGLAPPSEPLSPAGASAAPQLSMPPTTTSVGGIMTMSNLAATLQQDAARAAATDAANAEQNQPVVMNLAAQIRKHWSQAKTAKIEIEQKMLRAVRARRGEYDPDQLAQIRRQGGSEIYMMLFATKARQAKALLTDVFISSDGSEKPFTISPSPHPDLPPEDVEQILQGVAEIVYQAEASGLPMTVDQVRQLMQDAKDRAESQMIEQARRDADCAEEYVADVLFEGGWLQALDEFLDDLTTFKTAFIKGPIVRKQPKLQWVQGPDGKSVPQIQDTEVRQWERIDPFMIYPAGWARTTNDAYLIERHKLEPQELSGMREVEGYSAASIDQVLDAYGHGGLHEWLAVDTAKAQAEGRTPLISAAESDLIDALQYWGPVSGKLLREWGMDPAQVPDEGKYYQVEAWLIGSWVIKAVINPDPLGRRPYYSDGFARIPGAFWHNSLYDVIEDCQNMCNSAARALANNLGIASGPQVDVNVQRLADGEDIETMYPWKIWQTTSDPVGSTAKAVNFFQPTSNAAELMGVYEKFSMLADEYSGIPRYMTGQEGTPGAGRTASGLSMMIGNASKMTKQLIASVDMHIISPSVEREYENQIQTNPNCRGDLQIQARGAISVTAKEAAQVRRIDFLARTANPFDMQIMGMPGRAAVLREVAKSLDMDPGEVVPSASDLRLQAQAQQMLAQQQAAQPASPGKPGQPPQPGQPPALAGPQQRAPSGEQLMDGSPTTDHFSPSPN